MAETKEKQWAVLHISPEGRVRKIVWFDARVDARKYTNEKRAKNKSRGVTIYRVMAMTRGPRA